MDPAWEDITDDEDFLELVNNVAHSRVPQVYRERPDHFTTWNDKDFKARFRLEKQAVRFIIEEISGQISSVTDRNHAVTAAEMVCTALRFLATGRFLQVVGDFGGINKSTASRKIYMVLEAIAQLGQQFIKMPRTEAEMNSQRQGFFNIARFPRCIGALDCTHIKIQSPGGADAENFRNMKGFYSYNVQAIGSSDLKFQNIVCRWPGSAYNANIFRNSSFRNDFENGIYGDNLLVADSGYAINPGTPAEHLFNEAQIRTRNPIERAFGVLKRRFPIFSLRIRLKQEKVEAIFMAAVVLHNIALSLGDAEPPEINEEIAAAIELTNNVNNNITTGQVQGGINNSVRYTLLNNYFQNLL